MCVADFTVDAELLAKSQHSEGPATGHLETGFSWFPCVYKQMLRWLPTFQVATTCFSCSPPDLNLNLSLTSFIFCLHVKKPLPPRDSSIAVNNNNNNNNINNIIINHPVDVTFCNTEPPLLCQSQSTGAQQSQPIIAVVSFFHLFPI